MDFLENAIINDFNVICFKNNAKELIEEAEEILEKNSSFLWDFVSMKNLKDYTGNENIYLYCIDKTIEILNKYNLRFDNDIDFEYLTDRFYTKVLEII